MNYIKTPFLFLIIFLGCSESKEPLPTVNIPNQSLNKEGVLTDTIDGVAYIIYGNTIVDTYVAYEPRTISGHEVNLTATEFSFPLIFEDSEGGLWNIFGHCISGPHKDQQLVPARFQLGYFFSFASFFPEVTLYNDVTGMEIAQTSPNPEWLINPQHISQGALQDAIPAIDEPMFTEVTLKETTESLYDENELFVVTVNNEEYNLYPHEILDWHEVINDQVNSEDVVLSYCPLTGTSMMWASSLNGGNLKFGVSGLLYNSNLILYDRNTSSYWSQILEQAINGDFIGARPERVATVEVNWTGAKMISSDLNILSENTGYSRDYDFYPYGDYKTSELVFFPLTYTDNRAHPKERVMAIIHDNKAKIYRFKDLPSND